MYGAFTLSGWLSQNHSTRLTRQSCSPNPGVHALRFGLFRVRSPLLTESHVVFSSSGYLDVSVHRVPFHSLWMDRSPGFGSTPTDYFALFRLGFPSAPGLQPLTSPASVTRRTVLQKVRGSSYKDVPQLVTYGFRFSFTPLPGSPQLVTYGFRFSFTPLPGSFSPFLHSTMRYRSLRSI